MDGTEQKQFVNTFILLVRFIVVFNSNVSCLMLLVLHLIIHTYVIQYIVYVTCTICMHT